MAILKHYIIIGNRKHGYTLRPAQKGTVLVCKSADINARFPNDEIPRILSELPHIIIRQIQSTEAQSEVMRFRVTPQEKVHIAKNALDAGFDTISAYLRYVALSGAPPEDEPSTEQRTEE